MTELELTELRLKLIGLNVDDAERDITSEATSGGSNNSITERLLFRLVKAVSYIAGELAILNTPRSK